MSNALRNSVDKSKYIYVYFQIIFNLYLFDLNHQITFNLSIFLCRIKNGCTQRYHFHVKQFYEIINIVSQICFTVCLNFYAKTSFSTLLLTGKDFSSQMLSLVVKEKNIVGLGPFWYCFPTCHNDHTKSDMNLQ